MRRLSIDRLKELLFWVFIILVGFGFWGLGYWEASLILPTYHAPELIALIALGFVLGLCSILGLGFIIILVVVTVSKVFDIYDWLFPKQ